MYIPLGGNRMGKPRQIFNMFVVWTLTGLWHGASWNFVIWGVYFFAILVVEKHYMSTLEALPDWVCRCIRRRWRKGPFAGEILRLKFQRPVLPGERVRFTLSRLEGERYSFSFKIGESVCTSGIMAWKSE